MISCLSHRSAVIDAHSRYVHRNVRCALVNKSITYKVIPYFNLSSATYRIDDIRYIATLQQLESPRLPRGYQYAQEDTDRKKRNRFTTLISRAPARPVADVADTERQNDVSYDPLKSRAVTGCAVTRSPLPGEEAPSKQNKGVVSRKWKSGGAPAGRT